ncbi:hypothetical protein PRIPAC_71446, partial [Pristionchus pacificus]|uniref:Uncharacterized protein n=1 Tax=Pristionchus pacificus TaxID=54126 RepID=A0A2A6CF27_PRIPA
RSIQYNTMKLLYEAVCERVEQIRLGLAQLKHVYFLKISYSGFSRVLMTMSIVIFHIEPPLAPDDVTSKTTNLVTPVRSMQTGVISIKFYPGSQTHLILLIFWGEKIHKNRFRRDVVWSQRRLNMKNDYSHRHQHP